MMAMYEIDHIDASELMRVEAESAAKAKYKNYLNWREAFNTGMCTFMVYLSGVNYCRKVKGEANDGQH